MLAHQRTASRSHMAGHSDTTAVPCQLRDTNHGGTIVDVDARSLRRGRLLILAATVMWSTSGFFAKAPLMEAVAAEHRGIQLAFWRALFAALALFPFVRRPTWSWRLVPAAATFAAMNITFLMAMTTTTEANAIWLQYTAPLWVFVVGVWWLAERATKNDYLMLLFGTLGVTIILFFESRHARASDASQHGVVWGLLSGFFFAGVVLSIRALRNVDSVWVVAVCHLAAAVVLAPIVLTQQAFAAPLQFGPINLPPPQILWWFGAFGVFQMGIPYVLFAWGTRAVTGHQAAFIALLEPLLVPFWVWLVWRHTAHYQSPAWWTLLGGSSILLGLLLSLRRPD